MRYRGFEPARMDKFLRTAEDRIKSRAQARRNLGHDIINLACNTSDILPPKEWISDSIRDLINLGYISPDNEKESTGCLAVSEYYKKRHKVHLDPRNEIILFNNIKEALYCAGRAYLENG
ncbi:MAG: hypothetical protein QW728_06640, partial [Thermoplasmata archaeon]